MLYQGCLNWWYEVIKDYAVLSILGKVTLNIGVVSDRQRDVLGPQKCAKPQLVYFMSA